MGLFSVLTDVVGLIKDDHTGMDDLLGHDLCDLGVQQVVVAVDDDVRLLDLRQEGQIRGD